MEARIVERFWSRVERGPSDACWLWRAGIDKDGYGKFVIEWDRQHRRVKNCRAHRVSYELAHGPIPGGLHCLHRCDNPGCVNPSHLFLGTTLDNTADRQAKRRQARGLRQGAHTRPERRVRGERVGNSKLSSAQVLAVRDALSRKLRTQRQLARELGVHQTTISLIWQGKNWSHL
jgi:hypothetical protein